VIVLKQLHSQSAMTLIELLIALVVMAIGITALVAAFSSGIVVINRGSKTTSAAALADQKMESYRGASYSAIVASAGAAVVGSNGRTYWRDSAVTWICPLGAAPGTTALAGNTTSGSTSITGLSSTAALSPRIGLSAASAISAGTTIASIDSPTAITITPAATATASNLPLTFYTSCSEAVVGRPLKKVTITVRDGSAAAAILASESSTFDQSTG
jgi:prepilin-type N-terminal cleavage/methylation domain-containing protein